MKNEECQQCKELEDENEELRKHKKWDSGYGEDEKDSDSQKVIRQIKKERDIAIDERDRINDDNGRLQKEKEEIQKKLDDSQKQLRDIQEHLKDRLKEEHKIRIRRQKLQKERDRKDNQLNQENETLQQQLEQEKSEIEELKIIAQNYWNYSQQEIKSLRNDCEYLTEQNKVLKFDLEQTQSNLDYLRTISRWFKENNDKIINQKRTLQAEKTDLINQIREKNLYEEELLDGNLFLFSQLEDANETFADYRKRAEIEVSRLREILKELKEGGEKLQKSVIKEKIIEYLNNHLPNPKQIISWGGLLALTNLTSGWTGYQLGKNNALMNPGQKQSNVPVSVNITNQNQEPGVNSTFTPLPQLEDFYQKIFDSPLPTQNTTTGEIDDYLDNQQNGKLVPVPADLPADWKEQLKSIPVLKEENGKLANKIKELEKRPTLENYQKLKNNLRPINLPPNWENELKRIPELEKKIGNLGKRPSQKKYDETINSLNNELEKKDKDLKNKNDEIANLSKKNQEQDTNYKNQIGKLKEEQEKKWNGARDDLDQAKKINTNLTEKLAEKERENKQIKDEKAKVVNELNDAIAKQKKETDDLNEKLPKLVDKLTKLEAENQNLHQPGMTKKIFQQGTRIIKNHPVESTIGGAILTYLSKEWLKKWRNIQKVQDLETEKNNLEQGKTKLRELTDDLVIKLRQEKSKTKKLTTKSNTLLKKAQQLKSDYEKMKDRYEVVYDNKKEAYRKLKEIKQTYAKTLQQAQNKNLSLELVPYKLDHEKKDENTKLNHSLTKNISLLVEKVGELQQNRICSPCSQFHADNHTHPTCSHSDYNQLKNHTCPKTCSETYHQQIKNEREQEVISQINTDCKLGCEENSNRQQIINRIKELISTPGGECLNLIIRLEKETMDGILSSHLFNTYSEKLGQVNNYQELAAQRAEIIKAQLAENSQVATVSPSENKFPAKTIFFGSLIITLLTVGGILILKSKKKSGLPVKGGSGVKAGSATLPTLQQINRYLVENNIRSLEVDEVGGVKIGFKG